jgi:hypothetical protein
MAEQTPDDKLAKSTLKNLEYLASIRQPYEDVVDDVIKFVNHSRRMVRQTPSTGGNKTGSDVYDGSAIIAVNMLVDGMVGYLCSRNIRWFKFDIPQKLQFHGMKLGQMPEVRRYLDDCEDQQYAALNRSNFYDIVPEFLRDGAVPGTAHLLSEEDVREGRIIFTVPHFKECYIAENQFGQVDTNYRVYNLTMRQLEQKFGQERMVECDRNWIKTCEANPYQDREVLHAVYPRTDCDHNRIDSKSKPIASLWILKDKAKVINESGYDWMPSITWRWRKNSDERYGRSPSWDALVDILKANEIGKSNLIAAQKMVEPPIIAPSDLRGQIHMGPRGQTFMDRNLSDFGPRPLFTGIQLPFGTDQQDRVDAIIRQHFAVDFFLMLSQAAANKVELTATQTVEMMGEKAAVLGTRVGMLQSEALDPIHDRVFDIEARAGRMPPPPAILQELSDGKIEIQYLGPLAQAQIRLSKSRSIASGISLVTQIAAVAPTAMDVVDWDGSVVEALDSSGFPMHLIRTPEQIMAIRQQRQQQEQAQQQLEALNPISKALRAGGTKPEEGSPVQQLINPAPEQGAA